MIPQQWLLSTNLEVNKLEQQKNSRFLRHTTWLCYNISISQYLFLSQRHDTSCILRCSVLSPTQRSKPIRWILIYWFSKISKNTLNGAVLVICGTIRNVVASAAEAETGGLFGNSQEIIPIRRGLDALDHPQPPTPVKTYNTNSDSFVYSNIRKRGSKTWYMHWNWLRDKENHQELKYY